jgi:hypothetical protein
MGHSHVVRFLIETDPSADHLDMKDITGRTALACTVEGRKTDCAALLCEAGASGAEQALQRLRNIAREEKEGECLKSLKSDLRFLIVNNYLMNE